MLKENVAKGKVGLRYFHLHPFEWLSLDLPTPAGMLSFSFHSFLF